MDRYTPTITSPIKLSGQISGPGILVILAALAVIAIAVFVFYPEPEPMPIPEPTATRPLETVAPAETEEERGDDARQVIAELRSSPDGVDYQAAFLRGQEFRSAGRMADAQLLYFFAARGGHGPAALELGALYDPNTDPAEGRLTEDPDPFQAYKWYRDAAAAGEETATARLAELRVWAEAAADGGDQAAEQLLLQWE